MAPSQSKPAVDSSPHFLNLPAEIRNLIYTKVLVSNARIRLTKDNCQQTALLRVNRQIRQEARGIYYCQNNFRIHCPDFDSRALLAFRKQSKEVSPRMHGVDGKKPHVSLKPAGQENPRSWYNLFCWLKALHGDNFVVRFNHKGDPGRQVARAMMLVAVRLQKVPWTEVIHILRDVASAGDVAWTDYPIAGRQKAAPTES